MPNIYVRSTDGSDADNGSTWALAKATLTGAAAIDAAGDTIYLSQVHAESTNAAVAIALAGTAASPTRIVCGNDAAEPPTAAAATATLATGAGNYSILFTGAAFYVYGLGINCGVGSTSALALTMSNTSGARARFKECVFAMASNNASARIDPVPQAGQLTTLEDCDVSFGSTSQGLRVSGAGVFVWNGGAIASGSSAVTALFATAGANGSRVAVSGVDLSNGAAGMNIFTAGNNDYGVIRNCKLPASWSGSLTTGTIQTAARYEMFNCDSSDTNYRLWIADFTGAITSETTVVRTGGASDGTTSLSWKMVTNANAEYPLLFLATPEVVQWNETTASAITATVEIVTDNVTLTDEECWLEVQYLGTSGTPLGSFITDAKADVLATAANQTSSSVTWTTTGLGTPVKQKLSVTFTPQEKGFIHAVVKVAKASATVYVDPLLTIT